MPNVESARCRAVWMAEQFKMLTVWAYRQQAPIQQAAVARVLTAIAFDLARAPDGNHGDRSLEASLVGLTTVFLAHAAREDWRPCSIAELTEYRLAILDQVLVARVIGARLSGTALTAGGAA